MLASQVITMLQNAIAEHGDLPLVSGVSLTGYGSFCDNVTIEKVVDESNETIQVLDITFNTESNVTTGGW